MSDPLDQLYQEVILEHNKNPRNFKVIKDATHYAHGHNPLCGDDYFVFLKLTGNQITEIGFQGNGCAISKASASMMTTAVAGKSREEANALLLDFICAVTTEAEPATKARLKNLRIFESVKKFPVRVKCATLAWRALEQALSEQNSAACEISTE